MEFTMKLLVRFEFIYDVLHPITFIVFYSIRAQEPSHIISFLWLLSV